MQPRRRLEPVRAERLPQKWRHIAGTSITAWLKACIRSGGTSYAPMSTICAGCNQTPAPPTATRWKCTGALLPYNTSKHVGLQTGTSCRRVGINKVSTEGFWTPSASSTATADGAVCCHP